MGTASAVSYNKVPFGDANGPVTAGDLDRVQQEIQNMAARIPGPQLPNVVSVSADYQVKGTEDVLHVDAQAGPVKITLLNPSARNRPLTIKQVNLQTGKTQVNPVTIATRDGSNTIAGKSSIALDDTGTGSVSISADNSQHWPSTSSGGNPPVAPAGSGTVYVGIPPIFVEGNQIGIKQTPGPGPTPTPTPTPVVTPWVAPVPIGDALLGDQTGVESWIAESMVDFTGAPGLVTLYWWFQALSSAPGGVFNVRIGGSAYRALDGAIAATWPEPSATMTARSVPPAVFMAPVGIQRVTVSAQAPAAGQKAQIQGINLVMR